MSGISARSKVSRNRPSLAGGDDVHSGGVRAGLRLGALHGELGDELRRSAADRDRERRFGRRHCRECAWRSPRAARARTDPRCRRDPCTTRRCSRLRRPARSARAPRESRGSSRRRRVAEPERTSPAGRAGARGRSASPSARRTFAPRTTPNRRRRGSRACRRR